MRGMCSKPFAGFLRAVIDHGNPIFTFPCITYRGEKGEETLTVVQERMMECIGNDWNAGLFVNGKAVTNGIESFIVLNHKPLSNSSVKQVVLTQKAFDGCLFVAVHAPYMNLNFC